jgi:hypothetical protein
MSREHRRPNTGSLGKRIAGTQRGTSGHPQERSGFAEFERKRWTEEAKLQLCPECGSAAGRHMPGCPRV